jgi:CRP/FNR family transcriptional regulator
MAREITAQDRILEKIPLFISLTAAELQQVREKFVIKSFKKNEVILKEEDTNEYMYIILDGEAKVVNTNEKEKEMVITMHRSGDFFGELSLIDGKTTPATIIAAKNSVTAIISKKDFYSLLFSQSKVAENLLKVLCSRFRDNLKKIQMLNFNNAAQRIKMLFLMLSDDHGEKTDEGTILNIKLLHQDIAEMTGLARETVTRILDKWQRSGEIKILKNRLILLCPEFESIAL